MPEWGEEKISGVGGICHGWCYDQLPIFCQNCQIFCCKIEIFEKIKWLFFASGWD